MILLQLQFQGEPEGMGDWVSITPHPGFQAQMKVYRAGIPY